MPTRFSNIVINPNVFASSRRFRSSMVGFGRIALGPPLQKLSERWNLLKIVVSCIVRFIFMLSAKYIRMRFPESFLVGSLKTVKTEVGFLVLLLTSLYCYYENPNKQRETGAKGYRSTLRLIYFEAFALMSLSLSTQAQSGFKLDTSNFLLACLVLGINKENFMIGVGVAVLCYVAMSSRPCSDSRQEQRRRGGGEPDDVVVVGDGLLEETPQILSSLPLTIHPSPSLSTVRRRPVNSESLVILTTPSPILRRQISLKTLSYVSLSASEYWTLLRSEWNFTKSLPHLRFRNSWSDSIALIPSSDLPLLMGPDDEL